MSTPTRARFLHIWNRQMRRWDADLIKPNGERFGIVMPLYRLVNLLRGA